MSEQTVWRVGVVGATGLFAPTYLNPAIDLPELELRAIAARPSRTAGGNRSGLRDA